MKKSPWTEPQRRYLEAGLSILKRNGPRIGLGDVKITDVGNELEVSKAAVYKAFDNAGGQANFRQELAKYAFETIPRNAAMDTVAATAFAVAETGGSFAELVRQCAKVDFDMLIKDTAGMAVLYALYASASQDKSLRKGAHRSYSRTTEEFVPIYEQILKGYEMQIVPPWELEDFAVALEAVADGFVTRYLVQPEAVDKEKLLRIAVGEPEKRWSLFAYTIYAVVDTFVEDLT